MLFAAACKAGNGQTIALGAAATVGARKIFRSTAAHRPTSGQHYVLTSLDAAGRVLSTSEVELRPR